MNPRFGIVLAVVVLLAGCTGGAYSFEASPANVADDALSGSGYGGDAPEPFTLRETFEIGGVGADVTATSWTATYTNDARQGSLIVTTSPDATIAGQSVNPLIRLSDEALLERVLGLAGSHDEGDVDDLEVVGSETRTILGEETEVTTFETTADTDMGEVLIHIHFATVSHDGDIVVLVGAHPADIDEKETLLSLMESIDH